jgi:hypothetical protein
MPALRSTSLNDGPLFHRDAVLAARPPVTCPLYLTARPFGGFQINGRCEGVQIIMTRRGQIPRRWKNRRAGERALRCPIPCVRDSRVPVGHRRESPRLQHKVASVIATIFSGLLSLFLLNPALTDAIRKLIGIR